MLSSRCLICSSAISVTLAQRPVAGHDNLQDRHRVGIELLDHRRQRRLREVGNDQVDLVANFLRRDVAVLLEQERARMTCDWPSTDEDRSSSMPLMVLTRAFDLLGDFGLDLLGRRARIDHRDGTVGTSMFGSRSTPRPKNE